MGNRPKRANQWDIGPSCRLRKKLGTAANVPMVMFGKPGRSTGGGKARSSKRPERCDPEYGSTYNP